MKQAASNEATPDTLMAHFHGSSLKTIIVFTLVVHAVVLIGSSGPFLWKKVFRADTAALSKQERVDNAVREAAASLREIAEDYDLNPQDISSRFTGGGSRTVRAAEPKSATPTEGEAPVKPEQPKSTIEKKLETKADGPEMPSVKEATDDIF